MYRLLTYTRNTVAKAEVQDLKTFKTIKTYNLAVLRHGPAFGTAEYYRLRVTADPPFAAAEIRTHISDG